MPKTNTAQAALGTGLEPVAAHGTSYEPSRPPDTGLASGAHTPPKPKPRRRIRSPKPRAPPKLEPATGYDASYEATAFAKRAIASDWSRRALVARDAVLKPALASIKAACEYMGGISRAKFYADILPHLETVKLGNRRFVVVRSMDEDIRRRTIALGE